MHPQVRDVRFFDGIVLSTSMVTDHLLSSYIEALGDVASTTSRTRGRRSQ